MLSVTHRMIYDFKECDEIRPVYFDCIVCACPRTNSMKMLEIVSNKNAKFSYQIFQRKFP